MVGQTVCNAKVLFLSWGVWSSGTVLWGEQLEESVLTKLGSILDQLKEIINSEWDSSVG
jgi:hypothetical protein